MKVKTCPAPALSRKRERERDNSQRYCLDKDIKTHGLEKKNNYGSFYFVLHVSVLHGKDYMQHETIPL